MIGRGPNISIRVRLLMATAVLLGMAALAPVVVLPDKLEAQARAELERRALDIARAFGAASEVAIDFGDRQRAAEILQGLESVEGARYGELRGVGDVELAAWGATPPWFAGGGQTQSLRYDPKTLHVAVPIETPGGERGSMRFGLDLADLARRRHEARRLVALTALAVFAGGLLASFLVTTLLTKPVRTLSILAERIARGDEDAVSSLATSQSGEAGAVAEALERVVGKLAAQRAMLESQSEATSEGILTLSTKGRVITHNRRFVELWRLSTRAVDESWTALRPHLELANGQALPAWLSQPVPALSEGTAETFDVTTHDGRTLNVHASRVRKRDGEVLGLGLYFRDVTQRVRDKKRIEDLAQGLELRVAERTREVAEANAELARSLAELKRTQEQLVVADRRISLGRLAAGVAHEINNPLAYLVANVSWVRDGLRALQSRPAIDEPPHLAEMERALADAADGAGRVAHIVRGLKQFSRGDEDSRTPVALEKAVEAAIDMAGHEVRHRARLVRELGPAPHVEGNEVRLSQVILNLLLNAAQSIDAGAIDRNTITVSVGTDLTGWAFVEVRDTGSGIPPEIVGRIYDPFFTTKAQGEGSGLGLSISQGIVTSFGGTIEVESERGRGSAFRVRLPPAGADTPKAASASARATQVPRTTVLIVDDEPMVATAMKRLLEKEHEVVVATDARTVLQMVSSGVRFGHILCDLMMPGMTGMDLHEELCVLAPDQAARMVFMTGGAFTTRTEAFAERHRDRLVLKPVELDTLRRIMHATSCS